MFDSPIQKVLDGLRRHNGEDAKRTEAIGERSRDRHTGAPKQVLDGERQRTAVQSGPGFDRIRIAGFERGLAHPSLRGGAFPAMRRMANSNTAPLISPSHQGKCPGPTHLNLG